MSFNLSPRVYETSSTTGTGAYTLAGAVSTYRAFSTLANGDTCFYGVWDGVDYEEGLGTYNSGAGTLSRTAIYKSSNANNAVNWGPGTRNILITLPSSAIQSLFDPAQATGFVARTAAQTYAGRSLATGNTAISISNPAGIAGNPTIGLTLGAGLKELASAVVARLPVSAVTASTLITTTARAQIIDIASAIAISVATASTVGSDFFCGVKNSTVASVVITSPSLVDGSSTITLKPAEGITLVCSGTTFRALGRAVTPDQASDTAAGVIEIAVKAEMEAASAIDRAVTPGRMFSHPGVAKARGKINASGTILGGYGISSVTVNGTGDVTVHWSTPFANTNYTVDVASESGANVFAALDSGDPVTVSTVRIKTRNSVTGGPTDPVAYHVAAFGEQ